MKKVNLILILFVCLGTISFSQTVTIGTQVWMTKNLDVSTFRNGDPIPQAKSNAEWQAAGENKQPAWCYYDNDPANGAKYGKLYNWYAVNDARGLAPAGWHIPSYDEWTILTDYLGGKSVAGNKMKSKSGWEANGNGTNSSGFSALLGGNSSRWGRFDFIGLNGYWWSSTEREAADYVLSLFLSDDGGVEGYGALCKSGLSVRCLLDQNLFDSKIIRNKTFNKQTE